MISKAYQSRHKGITEQTQKKSIADTKVGVKTSYILYAADT